MSTYFELLRHPSWQKKRLEVLQRGGWKCSTCLTADATLNVHHKKYIKGHKPWEYEDSNFVVLCDECHSSVHRAKERINDLLMSLDACSLDAWVAKIAGSLAPMAAYANDRPLWNKCTEAAGFWKEEFLSGALSYFAPSMDDDQLKALLRQLAQGTFSNAIEKVIQFSESEAAKLQRDEGEK